MLEVGIIGCGRIVEEAHAAAWREIADLATVTAIADPSPQRRALVGELLDVPAARRFPDAEALLTGSRVDLVDAAVPHVHHRGVVEAAAAAGVSVLSEKPLAAALADVDAMIACTRDAGVQLGVVHNYLHRDATLVARRWLDAGRVGRPLLYRNEWVRDGHYVGAAAYDPDWRTRAGVSGGGCLLDEGYHTLYLAEHLVGSPITSLTATTATYRDGLDVDDTAVVTCRHASGATTSLTVSWAGVHDGTAVDELHGSDGAISFTRPGTSAAVRGRGDAAWDAVDDPYVLHRSFARAFREALEHLDEHGRFLHDGAAGRRVTALIDAAYRSAASGARVDVGPPR